MAIIAGVVTDDARVFWPQEKSGLVTFNVIDEFKVGEGGWIDPGSGKVRRIPDPALRNPVTGLQDIDAAIDADRPVVQQRYPADSRATFTKSLTVADMLFETPSILRVAIRLDFGEFNDDGFANSPELWEVGIFQDHPLAGSVYPAGTKLMVGYATFPQETKSAAVQLENIIRLIY
jgi:hypothetical protein